MLGNLFRQRSHYVYDYKPRYYDPRKERIEKLERQHAGGNNQSITFEKATLKAQWARKKKSASKNVNMRLAVIITILATIAFFGLGLDKLI